MNEVIMENFEAALQLFLEKAQVKIDKFYNQFPRKLVTMPGRKYIRVAVARQQEDLSSWQPESSWAFIGPDGAIYMPASWKTPAKHARGNIFSAQGGMEAVGEFSINYMR